MINLDIKLWQVGAFKLGNNSSNCIIFRRLRSKNSKKNTLKPSSPWPFEPFCLCFLGPPMGPLSAAPVPRSQCIADVSPKLSAKAPVPCARKDLHQENTKAKDRPELGGFDGSQSLFCIKKFNTTEKSGLWFLVLNWFIVIHVIFFPASF